MLQVDPKKRITVKKLLSHPWITLGIYDPIEVKSEHNRRHDHDCVAAMAKYNSVTIEEMWRHLKRWRYDYHTATYLLLLQRKSKGQALKLSSAATKVPVLSKSVSVSVSESLKLLRKTIFFSVGYPFTTQTEATVEASQLELC